MRTPITLVVFAAGLVVLFGLAISLGQAVGPLLGGGLLPPDQHEHEHGDVPAEAIKGLAIADRGFVIHPVGTRFTAGERDDFLFNIFTVNRRLVTEYETDHEEEMHLVVVRRDMTGYQHLHPELMSDGTWKVRMRLREPGSYRAFATFRPENVAQPVTLGVDLEVPGMVDLRTIPQPRPTAETGDYTVMIDGEFVAGRPSRVFMNVLHNDEPVTDLQPHLGELGHLVLLREGDLAYLHTHPVPTTVSDQTISFDVDFPTPGFYRAFLEFQHLHQVHTVEFTVFAR